MASRSPDLVSVLEAAYAVDRQADEWLQELIDAIRPSLDVGLGIAGYLYDTNDRPFKVRHFTMKGCPIDSEGLAVLTDESNDEYVRGSWIARSAMMASETPGFAAQRSVREVLQPAGIEDIMVVNAIDPIGVGCWIGAPTGDRRPLVGAERERWNRVAAHVRSALRLRLRLGAPERAKDASMEAVLTPEGRIRHLESAAEAHRGALQEAVVGISRARTKLRGAPDQALPSWKALVRARWTLVDDFQRDGSRYVLARVNAIETTPIGRLSARERQVVACLSMGFTNKEIAYELGLSASTVRVHAANACAKANVATREELVEAYRRNALR